MLKREFKVGEKYKGKNYTGEDVVIEITEIIGCMVFYKDVVGKTFGIKSFSEDSIFANTLKKLEEAIVIYRKDNKVIALDKFTGKKAEAKCNPTDEFDFRTGAKLAFQRLIGESVGDNKSDSGVREVKRKAKVGEYIKIVNGKSITGIYKNGDICMVIMATNIVVIMEKDGLLHGCAGHEEYVVLENYNPEEKTEDDREIHVGDMVEVTYSGHCYSTYDIWSGLGSYRQNYVKGVSTEDGMVAKVLNIAQHDEDKYETLALIQNPKTSQVFIIKADGIKKVER